MNKRMIGLATLMLAPLNMVLSAQGLSYSAFQTCISSAGTGSTCSLQTGTYYVAANDLVVGRSSITIEGAGMTADDTMLVRAYGSTWPTNTYGEYAIMTVPSAYSVTITNIEFYGNRAAFTGENTYTMPPTALPLGCPTTNDPVADLDVENGSTVVNGVDFWNAPGSAVWLKGSSELTNSHIELARSTGVFIFGSGTVSNTNITAVGTAAINVYSGSSGSSIYNNYLYWNRYEMPDGIGGGQLFTDPNSSYSTISENTINGNNWSTPAPPTTINGCPPPPTVQTVNGTEIYGTGQNLYNNDVVYNTSYGIAVAGSSSVTLSGSDPNCSGCSPLEVFGNSLSGISVYNAVGSNTGITFDHVRSYTNGQNGIYVLGATGTGFINDACLAAPAGYSPYVVASSTLTYSAPGSTTSCP